MAEENKRRRRKAERQKWKPHWLVRLLYKIWMLVFTVAKIALGAGATVALIGIICGLVFVDSLGDYLQEDVMPEASVVLGEYEMDIPSKFYYVDENGDIQTLQRMFATSSWQETTLDEVPDALCHAAIAIEDKRFYEHQGVDWFTTVKAVANMFFGDETVGGSSITQQLVKNITDRDEITVQRKVREFFDAVYVEKHYSKDAILQSYLNTIYLGQGCYGVKSAARTYFGKELQMLTIAECASLISITNNPSLFDPYSDNEFMYDGELMNGFQRNRHRQLLVLGEMLDQGWITQEEYDEAVAQELVLKAEIDEEDLWTVCPNETCGYEHIRSSFVLEGDRCFCPRCGTEIEIDEDASDNMYSWFVEAAIDDVIRDLAARDGVQLSNPVYKSYVSMLSRCGYHVYTTQDTEVQAQVDKIYQNLDEIPKTYSAQQLLSGIVIVDNRTGDIVALHGGVGEKTTYLSYSTAVDVERQAGSSIKPLSVYAPAFETGEITPATVMKDMPHHYEDDKEPYPFNETRTFSYARTIRSAIMDSVNTVSANTLDTIGVSYGYKYAKEMFRLSTLVDRYDYSDGSYATDNDLGSMSLGAQVIGVTVRDMTAAYAALANNGVYREARTYTKVYDSEGNIVLDNTQDSEKILSDKAVNYTNYCLVSAVNNGTGVSGQLSYMEVAGKTGTTGGDRDRWFCGFTGYYTAAVWCGYEMPEQIVLVGGGLNPAGQLWNKVMKPLHSGKSSIRLYDRTDLVDVTICLDSGKVATEACMADIRIGVDGVPKTFTRVETVKVYKEDLIKDKCDKHVMHETCSEGHAVANEYCKLFAEAAAAAKDPNAGTPADDKDALKIEKRGLLIMTQEEIDELIKLKKFGIESQYLLDMYVHLVDKNGKDIEFKGFENKIKTEEKLPYAVCQVHTKEAWEQYQASLPTQPSEPVEPEDPDMPWDDWLDWMLP